VRAEKLSPTSVSRARLRGRSVKIRGVGGRGQNPLFCCTWRKAKNTKKPLFWRTTWGVISLLSEITFSGEPLGG